jgi:hypothetical protein
MPKKKEEEAVKLTKWHVTTRKGVAFFVMAGGAADVKRAAMPELKKLGLDFETGVSAFREI